MALKGEIDTKSIESVQAAISLFGEKVEQKKSRVTSSDGEGEKDELESLQKELANCKVQLEAKESAHKQVLLKLQHYEERVDELNTMLKKSKLEKEHYIHECTDASSRVGELESKLKEMADKLSENVKISDELEVAKEELLCRKAELAASRKMESKAANRAEELLKHAEELREAIIVLKSAVVEKISILSEKDAEIEEKSRDMEKQDKRIEELETQLEGKSVFIESLQKELHEANELLGFYENAASSDVERLKAELEVKERTVSDLNVYVEVLEMELTRVKAELGNSKEKIAHLSGDIEVIMSDLEEAKTELAEVNGREIEYMAETAILKSELHKKIDDEAKTEPEFSFAFGPQIKISSLDVGISETDDPEYESPARDADVADPNKEEEVEALRKELESAMAKVGEFRTRAEQAITRAELAEKAKSALEDQLRSWREQKQRRRAALAALRQESGPRKFDPPDNKNISSHPPLFKVLNMKL